MACFQKMSNGREKTMIFIGELGEGVGQRLKRERARERSNKKMKRRGIKDMK